MLKPKCPFEQALTEPLHQGGAAFLDVTNPKGHNQTITETFTTHQNYRA